MKRLAILVEGQAEERFVKEILYEHFLNKNIFIDPIIITSSRKANGVKYKGGDVKFDKVINELKKLLVSYDLVSTLLDYYGIDEDFKGYSESLNKKTIEEKKIVIETALKNEISNSRFIPYIQMHEFEALLFSDVAPFIYVDETPELLNELKEIIKNFDTPEHINNSKETAPSKRIKALYKSYQKVTDGTLIAQEIGLTKIREKCKLFNEWISLLEK